MRFAECGDKFIRDKHTLIYLFLNKVCPSLILWYKMVYYQFVKVWQCQQCEVCSKQLFSCLKWWTQRLIYTKMALGPSISHIPTNSLPVGWRTLPIIKKKRLFQSKRIIFYKLFQTYWPPWIVQTFLIKMLWNSIKSITF